ncbi:MAG TPA: N-acetylmuramoyl-L-alanine amidase [Patescibacteria group bacterium]
MKKKIAKIIVFVAIAGLLGVGVFAAFPKIRLVLAKKEQKPAIAELQNEPKNEPVGVQEVPVDESAQQGMETVQEPQDEPQPIQQPKSTSAAQQKDATANKPEEKPASDDQNTKPTGVVDKLVSWGFQKSSSRTIKAIIIHTTYNALGGDPFDFSKVMQEWKDAGVAPHYAIDRSGTAYRLVADNNIAWHAGASRLPDGTTDVNGVSIGIEVVNDKDSKFTDAEYSALNSLIASLKKKYTTIKYVLGHDDIAPGRKTDPWNIEWNKVNR